MCWTADTWINLFVAIGTCGATIAALDLLPKIRKVRGSYWFSDSRDKDIILNLDICNCGRKSIIFDAENGVLIKAGKDSEYLTLKADKKEYFIYGKTDRHLHIKTPRTSLSLNIIKNNRKYELFIFTTDGKCFKLQLKTNQERQLFCQGGLK